MLIGRDHISGEAIYLWLVFLNVCLHSRSFLFRADWWKSDCSADGEPQGNWTWNSNSRDVIASCLSSFPTPPPECPGELVCRLKEGESTRPNSLPTWGLMVNNDA